MYVELLISDQNGEFIPSFVSKSRRARFWYLTERLKSRKNLNLITELLCFYKKLYNVLPNFPMFHDFVHRKRNERPDESDDSDVDGNVSDVAFERVERHNGYKEQALRKKAATEEKNY